jgi:hypothetical protein
MSYAKTRRRLTKTHRRRSWLNRRARPRNYTEFPPSRRRALITQQVLNALARSDRTLTRQRRTEIERFPGCPIFRRDVRGDVHRCQLPKDHAGVCLDINGYALVAREITPERRVDIALWLDEEARR